MFNETAYDYAIAAGCSPDGARTAAAIAQAESRGDTAAHNPVPPDDSYGLWQINMLGRLGPARRSQFGLTSNTQLFDPAVNAQAMYAISSGCQNWSPWSTFTSGAYRRFLQAFGGSSAQGSGGSPEGSGGVESGDPSLPSLDALVGSGALASGASGTLSWLPVAAIVVAAYFLLK